MTPTEYWKQRCLAAEKYLTLPPSYEKPFARKEWQQLVNTPEPDECEHPYNSVIGSASNPFCKLCNKYILDA